MLSVSICLNGNCCAQHAFKIFEHNERATLYKPEQTEELRKLDGEATPMVKEIINKSHCKRQLLEVADKLIWVPKSMACGLCCFSSPFSLCSLLMCALLGWGLSLALCLWLCYL